MTTIFALIHPDDIKSTISYFRDEGFIGSNLALLLSRGPGHGEILLSHGGLDQTSDYLVGLGELTLPGNPPLFAAGPLMTALLSELASDESPDGIVGGLTRLGVDEADAMLFAEQLRSPQALISVQCLDSTEAREACTMLQDKKAYNISEVITEIPIQNMPV